MSVPFRSERPRVRIFDTTLRDGEQSPGASMSVEEKVRIAHVLAQLGVDVIEAGFPVASPSDFASAFRIAEEVSGPIICGLSRAIPRDIEECARALAPAIEKGTGRIHTFISTSDLHITHKLKSTREDVLERIKASVRLARTFTDDVEWSAEDATRTEADFLCGCIEAAIEAGATTINLPDTVGYATPEEYGNLFRMVLERVPGADRIVLSAHCHDDLGLAVANSLAAIQAGARQVECTINGIGERAGNAAMEEIVMALMTRQAHFGIESAIHTCYFAHASSLVSRATGFDVPPNKAIVGANAFVHASGIHQDGVQKRALTYEIMRPEDVGVRTRRIALSRSSGMQGFLARLTELGIELTEREMTEAFIRFTEVADRKKEVTDEDLIAIVDEAMLHAGNRLALVEADIRCGGRESSARLFITLDNNVQIEMEGKGDGPIDAAFRAVDRALAPFFSRDIHLMNLSIASVSSGSDAQGGVTVRVAVNGLEFTGTSTHTDTVRAAVLAYLHALGKAMTYLERYPEDHTAVERPGQRPVL